MTVRYELLKYLIFIKYLISLWDNNFRSIIFYKKKESDLLKGLGLRDSYVFYESDQINNSTNQFVFSSVRQRAIFEITKKSLFRDAVRTFTSFYVNYPR